MYIKGDLEKSLTNIFFCQMQSCREISKNDTEASEAFL